LKPSPGAPDPLPAQHEAGKISILKPQKKNPWRQAKDFLEQPIYYGVVVVVVVVLLSLEELIAIATATTATAAATMPAVIPPAAAPVAPLAPLGACARALPPTNTDAIKIASAFFIFLSCIDLGKKNQSREIPIVGRLLSTKIRKLQAALYRRFFKRC
jgi:hypothetical protein